ncbi:MAG: autotransporter-associated beta strand repeat-containing protein, partial [Pseudorhodobacter sp.]
MRKTTLSATVSSAKLHASKHFPKRAHLLASTALVASIALSGQALAQQAWDPGATDGAIVGGTGAWDGATANWTVDAGVSNTTYNGTSPVPGAVFGGTGGTVTVTGAQSIGDLSFGVDGYTVTGGTLNIDAATSNITVTTGTATISSIIGDTAVGSLTKSGAGLLVLSGGNSYQGDTDVNAGTLRLSGGLA